MPELSRMGIGTIVFVVGAVIYIINILASLAKRGKPLSIDGVGVMVIGIGLALLLKW